MDANLEYAKKALASGQYTLVLYDGDNTVTADARGVLPLLNLYDSHKDFASYVVADKVVGRGAAFMYVLLGIKKVWANVISEGGLAILRSYGIEIYYDTVVPVIYNRTKTGLCPIESTLSGISDTREALLLIREKLAQMQ